MNNELSEHNLICHGVISKTIGFSCLADAIACAYILSMIPNCDCDAFYISRSGNLNKAKDLGYSRTMGDIEWPLVEKGLDDYMKVDNAQQWVIDRKNLLLSVIHSCKKWIGDVTIAQGLSKERLAKEFLRWEPYAAS